MKDFKNDSTSVLSRFGRDRRQRTVTATAERVERRPQRDAAGAERSEQDRKPERRASYNPHFSRDNRPLFEEKNRSAAAGRSFGRKDAAGRGFGEKSFRGKDSAGKRGGERPSGRDSFAESGFGERGDFGGRGARPFGGKSGHPYAGKSRSSEERGRSFDGKPSRAGAKPFAGGGKPFGRGGASDGSRGTKKFGGKSAKPAFRRTEKPASYPKYNPDRQIGEMRLNRFIAQSGICSRREADDFIQAGLVSVNGKIVTELGTKVLPTDEVRFNDSRVEGEKKVYLVLNKPKGYVTTLDDPHADKTVMDLVRGACEERIYPVGRLDKNSLGLLLFTNDGDLTRQLTHPSYRKKKIYQVTLDKPLTRTDMDRIAEGITLEDGEIYADEISYVKENKQEVGIESHSGRNRIVRRIFEFLGYTVTKLDRVYYAGLTKKNLKRGAWRFLTREEVDRIKSGQYE